MSTLTLGELIDALEACPAKYVRIAAPMGLRPVRVDSYRGYYEDLAIATVSDVEDTEMAAFLAMLRSAVGETFTGYKGGEYTMSRDTVVWVSNYGQCSRARVTGVDVDDDTAYLTLTVRWRK